MLCRISENPEVERAARCLALDLVDGLGKTSDVLAGDTSDRDTAVLGSVDGMLLVSVFTNLSRNGLLTFSASSVICSAVRPV